MKLQFKPYQGKPDKQRIINAIKGEPVDRVPNLEALIEDKIVEMILGRHIGGATLGNMTDRVVTKNVLDKAWKVHENLELGKEGRPIYATDFIEICEAIGQDVIRIGEFFAPFCKIDEVGKKVMVFDRSFKNRKDIKEKLIMPTENMDYFKWLLPYLEEYKKEAGKKNIAVMVSGGDLFQQLYEFIFGIEDFSLLLYDDYSLIEELIEAGVEYWRNFSSYMVNKAGIDIISFSDDLAFKSGLFVKYDVLKKLYLDRYKKVIEPAAISGIPIWFHSDGKIYDILNDLIEMGVNCINPMEPYSMDYRFLKKKYGKNLTLMGNIDITFPLTTGTPEDVRKDVKEHMNVLKPGYRYICASSHDLPNCIPGENIVAFFDAIHEFGVY